MQGHIDLFSGIGGFSLAAQWAGLTTEVFCENDKRCQDFLKRTYPGIPILPDVREFDGTKWRGRFLLTGGVPCQPASRAGKQRGKDDDRWLWPEAIRIVGEAKPAWCLFENPPGIGDVGLAGILADLEAQDYEVRVIGIPACAVGSPQIRNRYWIVGNCHDNTTKLESQNRMECDSTTSAITASQGDLAHNKGGGCQVGTINPGKTRNNGGLSDARRSIQGTSQGDLADLERSGRGPEMQGTRKGGRVADSGDNPGHMADTTGIRRQEGRSDNSTESQRWKSRNGAEQLLPNFWANSAYIPCADGKVRRAPDDTFGVAHGLHRSILAGLGNSIVPQVAYQIIEAIKEAHHA